jgi:hypothetical protein
VKRHAAASLSLDLDNLWSYMKTHGDRGWESYPSYLDTLVPIVLERFARHAVTVTCFVVGQDAALDRNREALGELARQGHEIGNHSFSHEPWFQEYDRARVEREIGLAEEAIERVTGRRPRGFRGPGFSLSRDAVEVLYAHGYDYDASTLPTFLGPLARAYYFWTSGDMPAEERRLRSRLFGTVCDGLRPLTSYTWDGGLLEIPVTTMPVLRVPFHMSYLIFLAGYSRHAFRAYLRLALALCRATGVEPSFLLHPLDFLGGDRVKQLSFFPGMATPTEQKLELVDEAIGMLGSSFRLVTLAEHARIARESGPLRSVSP